MGGFEPVIDNSTGKITGYKTTIGGADTVFPFSNADLLWSNSSPSADFAAQDITMNLSNYSGVIIKYKLSKTDTNSLYTIVFKSAKTVVVAISRGDELPRYRYCTVYDSKINFEGGYYGTTAGNQYIIPEKIWAITTVLDSNA